MTPQLHRLLREARRRKIEGHTIKERTGVSASIYSAWSRQEEMSPEKYQRYKGDAEKEAAVAELLGSLPEQSEAAPEPEYMPVEMPDEPESEAPPFFMERHGKPYYDQIFDESREQIIARVKEDQAKVRASVRSIIKRTHFKEAVLSDFQIPYQDDLALEIMFDLLRDYNPDMIYLLGDLMDEHATSRWAGDPTRKMYFLERELGRSFLHRLREEHPRSRIKYMEGNHEQRLKRYIWSNAPALADLLQNELSVEQIYGLGPLRIDYTDKVDRVGKLYHIHGHENFTKGQVVHVALRNLRWLKRSSICGHWHRFQYFPEKELDGSWVAGFVNGCLFDSRKMPGGGYTAIDTGQRGISLVDYDETGNFRVTQIPFIETGSGYSVWYNGQFLEYSRTDVSARAA